MSSLARMLSILNLFTPDRPTLAADEIIRHLKISQPTGYRYIQELRSAGLLSSQSGAYGLGVRIIELDYQIRSCDPLLRLVQPAMQSLCERLHCHVLLAVFIGDRVIVTREERGTETLHVSFGRGRVLPLLRGAGSKAILSSLPPARQRKLYHSMTSQIADAGLGDDWSQFRARLSAFRKSRIVISHAELEPGNVGVAAALGPRPQGSPASLVLVFDQARYAVIDKQRAHRLLLESRDQVDAALTQYGESRAVLGTSANGQT